jgi:hypothetical protein
MRSLPDRDGRSSCFRSYEIELQVFDRGILLSYPLARLTLTLVGVDRFPWFESSHA